MLAFLKHYKIKDYDFRLIFFVVALSIIGILLVGSAQPSVQSKQIVGLVLGLVVMVVASLFDYNLLIKYSTILYFINIVLLLLVRLIGYSTGGATRWISIGGFRFQPTELTKIILILFFATTFVKIYEKISTLRGIITSLILLGIPLALVLIQPDLSTSIVIFMIFISLMFVSGLSYKIVLGVLGVFVPAALIFLWLIMSDVSIGFLQGYQIKRIKAWLDPDSYPDLVYQQQNSVMAIGSGQIFGKGLNNDAIDSVKNGNFISEPQTDFIFAIAGEELGFVGCIVIIALLFLIVFECIILARKAKDLAGKLICVGVAAWIGFQAFINISVATFLIPNTGVTLPFVSYGLTSLVSLYIGIGIVLNVGLQPRLYR